jgi:hypothetical protein
MSFAADTGKESDFLRNCTMSGCVKDLLIMNYFRISCVMISNCKRLVL